MKKTFALMMGPLSMILIIAFADLSPGNPLTTYMAGITLWVAIWWLTEVVDLAITALLPLILMPMLGVCDTKEIAGQYMEPIVFLFVGGFLLSIGVEKWHLHQRMSLGVLKSVGDNPARILAAMMGTTFFISMWMSNTATTLMLYPAILAIYTQIQHITSEKNSKSIVIALLLGLAYAASIGGMATLVGTPTNMIFYNYFTDTYKESTEVTFFSWFIIGFPTALGLVIATYGLLRLYFIPKGSNIAFDKTYFSNAYQKLGKIEYEEKMMLAIYILTAILWFSRVEIPLGFIKIPGWSTLFSHPKWIQDSTVAITMGILLFFIPTRSVAGKAKSKTLMTWEDAQKLPLGIIFLFGGGFALAKGFEVSGLSIWFAGKLSILDLGHPFLIVMGVCVIICIISEFASNVASIQLALPILAVLSKTLEINPLFLMIPATLAASLGFMLPVATAPNTIVFGSRLIPVGAMFKVGFWIDIIGIIWISIMFEVMQ